MDDAFLVRVLHGSADLGKKLQTLLGIEAFLGAVVRDRFTLH